MTPVHDDMIPEDVRRLNAEKMKRLFHRLSDTTLPPVVFQWDTTGSRKCPLCNRGGEVRR